MIKISKLADYAMQILQVLIRQSTCMSAAKCANATLIPESTVCKVLKLLTEGGLLQSIQGPKGGYQLKDSPAHISLARVVGVIDGLPALTECSKAQFSCAQISVCGQQKNWQTISQIVFNVLDSISLADMATDLSLDRLDVVQYLPLKGRKKNDK